MARYGVSTEESVPRVTTASRTTLSDNQRLHHAISPGLFRYVSYSALGYLICLPSVCLPLNVCRVIPQRNLWRSPRGATADARELSHKDHVG